MKAALVLAHFGLQAIDLGAQHRVFVVLGLGRLFKVLNFLLEVLEVALLALAEGALGSAILSFALGRGFRCKRFASGLFGGF